MSIYVKLLFYVIPIFMFFIIFEEIIARIKGIKINHAADMISSLSSGITNIIRDIIKFGFVLISYSWLVNNFTIYKLEPLWLAVVVAFIFQDFSGYWLHRLNHRINILWNRHIIHHSSEEFNLSCGLRQSISDTFRFSAIFMFPAALLGIPSEIFVIISPIHLFMQFWYHTKLINKMGWLELVIVTPSHHRVHHAINKEYLDKNYGQIFIFWDKIFNTFQKELKTVSPVYGILRPAKTWNPIIINFKHLLQLIQDFWHTKNKLDKIIIWFMPTGWRPRDIILKYPIQTISKALELIKYNTKNSKKLIIWSWFQLCISMVIMFYIFIEINNFNIYVLYLHVLFLMLHIFSYTSLLDGSQYVILVETIKFIVGIIIINIQKFYYTDFGIIIYLFFSLCFTIYFLNKEKLL